MTTQGESVEARNPATSLSEPNIRSVLVFCNKIQFQEQASCEKGGELCLKKD